MKHIIWAVIVLGLIWSVHSAQAETPIIKIQESKI
jgi:hypothetical protein